MFVFHGNDQQSRLCNDSEMKKKSHMISSLLTNIAIGWHLNLFNSICTFLVVNEGRIVWNYFNRYTASKLVTARKRNCGKVMILHLSVILFTGRVFVQGEGLCPGGGFLSWGRGLCPGGTVSARGGAVSVQGGFCQGNTPCTVTSGRYASYWNAF